MGLGAVTFVGTLGLLQMNVSRYLLITLYSETTLRNVFIYITVFLYIRGFTFKIFLNGLCEALKVRNQHR